MEYRDRNDGWWKLALGAAAVGVIAFAFRGALLDAGVALWEGRAVRGIAPGAPLAGIEQLLIHA